MEARQQFSIVLPVRNGGEHVKECVHSILQQSYRGFNLLILENFSTDGTFEWLQSLNDERIEIIPADRPLSLEDNWSRISEIKRNEFLTIIGHDDLLDPDYLEVMSALIKKHPEATLYQTHFRFIDASGNFLRHCLPMGEVQQVHEFVGNLFMMTLDSMGSGYMMRSTDFDAVGGFSRYHNLIFGDSELWVRLTAQGYLATEHAECFSYREHSSASAGTGVTQYQSSLFKFLLFLDKEAQTNQKLNEVISRYCASYLDCMCEGLIYRGLRSNRAKDRKKASDIANEFDELKKKLMPAEKYSATRPPRIQMAILIDKWFIGRSVFKMTLAMKEAMKSLLTCEFMR